MSTSAPFTLASVPRLDGKTIVVTGANSGIGWEAARAFARAGARVVLACRSREKTDEAIARIRAEAPEAAVEFAALDLASLQSVRACAAELLARCPRIDVLVNNAGVMAIPLRRTAEGFEMQLGTNHLGHFAFTGLLFDRIAASAPARIVNVSSTAHRLGEMRWDDLQWEKGYAKWGAYGQSKLANMLFTAELDARLRRRGLDVKAVACHPGYAATNLQHVGPQMEGSRLVAGIMTLGNRLFSQSAADGALPTIYAAVAPEVEGNDYIGPDGFQNMKGAPAKNGRSARAKDAEAAKRLFALSEQLTGVRFGALDDGAKSAAG